MTLRIIVCAKQIPDPEAPASGYRIDAEAKKVLVPAGTPPVINPFDENALEAALRIKDTQECKVTVMSMGRNLSKAVLSKSLASGADDLILLQDDVFENLDSYGTALVLSQGVRKAGGFDLILAGRQAADWDVGQVGICLAEALGLPAITVARKIELFQGNARVEKILDSGYQVIEAPLPAVITVGSEIGALRTVDLARTMAARKQPVVMWNSQDLEVRLPSTRKADLLKLFLPQHATKCEFIAGSTPTDIGSNLATRLREIGCI